MKLVNGESKIDVVIPAHEKDLGTLPYCVAQAKKCVANVGRVFVISKKKLVDNAEWFDEAKFPFSKKDIEKLIEDRRSNHIGWYYQQLLKFYALFVVPNISRNALVLDSDTVLYRKMSFVEDGKFVFDLGKDKNLENNDFSIRSRKYIKTMLPSLDLKVLIEDDGRWRTGISHHMIFNKNLLEDFFERVSKVHKNKEFWKVFLELSNLKEVPSEYDLYFSFMLNFHKDLVNLRRPKYKNAHDFNTFKYYGEILRKKYHYCSYHERDYID